MMGSIEMRLCVHRSAHSTPGSTLAATPNGRPTVSRSGRSPRSAQYWRPWSPRASLGHLKAAVIFLAYAELSALRAPAGTSPWRDRSTRCRVTEQAARQPARSSIPGARATRDDIPIAPLTETALLGIGYATCAAWLHPAAGARHQDSFLTASDPRVKNLREVSSSLEPASAPGGRQGVTPAYFHGGVVI